MKAAAERWIETIRERLLDLGKGLGWKPPLAPVRVPVSGPPRRG